MVHPRPQLTRARWMDLCGAWDFAYDDLDIGVDDHWYASAGPYDRSIQVPFPPESAASGVGDTGFHPVVWYRRVFSAPQAEGERLLLHFGAVDYRASVWVNDTLVATHEGGHTPFSSDVTHALVEGDSQVVTVRAEDLPRDLAQPRGKQDWLERPHSVWYERTTGIWQPVWLEPVPATRVASLRWIPDLDRVVLRLEATVAGHPSPKLRLRVVLRLRGETLADDTYAVVEGQVRRDIALDAPRASHDRRAFLWAPDHPNLIDAEVTLVDGDDVVDDVRSYAGMRSVAISGGRFLLNQRPFLLRMVLAQNYWPDSHLAAPGDEALRREVELVKELGFNGVRIHQKVEDPRFLYWCDRLGVLVWGELPSALDFHTTTVKRLTREWLEVLDRDASVPSLMAWVPFNESWGVPNLEHDVAQRNAVRALYSLTKAMDPTRLVIGNDGWQHLASDVFTVHDYSASGDVLRERYGSEAAVERTLEKVQPYYRTILLPELTRSGQPLMVTEFGGITYDAASQDFWNGYGAVGTAEELLKMYEDLVTALLDSPEVAGFCYTQLTDTAQERNGLLTERREPKVDVGVLATVNRRPAASVPADAINEIQIVHAAELARRERA